MPHGRDASTHVLILAGLCAGIQWPKSHSPADTDEEDDYDLPRCFIPGASALDRRPWLAGVPAEKERTLISERNQAALVTKNMQGVRPGNPANLAAADGSPPSSCHARARSRQPTP